jgi:hypothetical protein
MIKRLLMSIFLLGLASVNPVGNSAFRGVIDKTEILNSKASQSTDKVASQTEWKGKCSQSGYDPYPMIMYVLTRKNNEITGILHWPTLRNSKSKFKGKIKDDSITFTEYELIQGSGISIPTVYEGKVVDDLISGIWIYGDERGTFYVELVSK